MKRKLFYIIITVLFCIMAYFSGIRHAESTSISGSYIPLDECIPLEDVACYYINESGFLCVGLKDIRYQMDDLNNNAYIDVLEGLEDVTELYNDRYVDMYTITGYSGTDHGLMIYTEDGNGYYLEVGMMD